MSATATATMTSTTKTRRRRRLSTYHAGKAPTRSFCQPLPHSLEALDLSFTSPTPTLSSLRLQLLAYLTELEARLSRLEFPISDLYWTDALKSKRQLTVEEASAWAKTALEMLERIRMDASAHLPELHLDEVPSVETFMKSHMPEFPDVFPFDNVRAHLPDVVRSHFLGFDLYDMCSRLDDIRSRISDIDFRIPLSYIPTLSEHLQSLHAHLSSMEMPRGISFHAGSTLTELLDNILSSEFVAEISSDIREGEQVALQIAAAVGRSVNGSRLIQYVDLPEMWRNNPFVKKGYRFIPLRQWPLLIMSLFALHNETLNIHTHLIPFVLWTLRLNPSAAFNPMEAPVLAFTIFALICLLASAIWHTMAGCAHVRGMQLCAQVDYVGIGWLISASVGTVVFYGFQCSPNTRDLFLGLCLVTGVTGSILPFCDWFNRREYRTYRIMFFLVMAFSALAPLAQLANTHSTARMWAFIGPITPSLLAYIVGLCFYATHFPERFLSKSHRYHWIDWLGGGSHAIWHIFIVLAISLHRSGMDQLKGGIGGVCYSS